MNCKAEHHLEWTRYNCCSCKLLVSDASCSSECRNRCNNDWIRLVQHCRIDFLDQDSLDWKVGFPELMLQETVTPIKGCT